MRMHDMHEPLKAWLDFKREKDGAVRVSVGWRGLHLLGVLLSAEDVALLREVL